MPSKTSLPEPIAVVGSACRFPGGSTSPSKLWTLLSQPRDVLQTFDPKRLNLNRFYHLNGDSHGSTDVQNKSYLLQEDSRVFDASFFSISPAEAEGMDPQQRVFLETVFEAFEATGCTLDQIQGSSTSVHVGVMNADYFDIQLRDTETIPKYNATGTSRSILSNRISYVFDLKGPSVTIDTACSSSLVALHQAIQSLHQGESSTAVVGGVNLIFDASMYIMESKMHMLSPDARSRMWDQSANGYARGEGVAALILKPLSHAVRDGDQIEGIVRSTGVNSNGQSSGITMPNAAAQASLIRQTYRRAGLNPVRDRCQFFECHGTGTPAGDPVEARAISEALFDQASSDEVEHPVYVGSIKTIIGHTEGCAGLAGVMKALLAIKHRTIPPNLLFENLNPAIVPYYGRLQVPTQTLPWPHVPAGNPLRASVNSFGFGGTNAHAIIESYDPDGPSSSDQVVRTAREDLFIGPLIFSAHSNSSLIGTVRAFWQHILDNPTLDLDNLAWVLQQRRTAHQVKIYFTGEFRQRLLDNMEQFWRNQEKEPKLVVGIQSQPVNPTEIPGVLGIFTGQGAQYHAMGRGLIETSTLFRKTIDECEAVLSDLVDGPDWSLRKELLADASTSRISEAALSQPLCTALQIALVNLLNAAGVRFDAVVGHSSGEIAAAYACGILTLAGAMQIAYYRGLNARLAHGPEGQLGGMIAVGISMARAMEFCDRPEFKGRLGVAASNAPQSVTLSGDLDAVEEAKRNFDEQNIFCRQLKVDTAYHSHHMQPCAESYLRSLLACDIEVRRPREGCYWISSVRGDTQLLKGDLSSLKGPYWVANMVQTVLFSQAVESSIWHGGPWDVAVEVGPHPALKAPTEQTIKAVFGTAPAYTGVLRRNERDVESISSALGFYWSHLGPSFVDFDGYRSAFDETAVCPLPRVLKDLPSYCWDHNKIYWRESHTSRRFRTGTDHYHELLGRRMLGDTEHELRWRNILNCSELSWVRGHEVLGQVLLPGAAYVSLAMEAGKHLAAGRSIRLLEVQDVNIRRPVVIPDGKEGIETIFIARLVESSNETVLKAEFSFFSCSDSSTGAMAPTCNGRVLVHFGPPSVDELPPREPVPASLLNVDVDRIYSALDKIGLNYQGIFRGLSNVKRSLNYSTSTPVWSESDLGHNYVLHPALLDVIFQSLFVARSHPNTEQMTNVLLPVHIQRVLVNPNVPLGEAEGKVMANADSFVVDRSPTTLLGDMHTYNTSSGHAAVQIEGLQLKAIAEPTESQDRHIFSETVWQPDASLNLLMPERDPTSDRAEMDLAEAIDRASLYYMQRLLEEIGSREKGSLTWYHQRMCEAFEEHLASIKKGIHPVVKREWLADGPEDLKALDEKYPNQIDLQLIHAIGDNLASVLCGETQLLEVMLHNNMLSRFYTEGCGFMVANEAIRATLQQITHKFPRAHILEVGAGTGATTHSVLNAIGNAYESYTYTDISPGFFEDAAKRFSDQSQKMVFKTLNIEKPVVSQGYMEKSYDIIIAANVLHATRELGTTLQNVRSLLRPGGFLVLVEVTGHDVLRLTFIMGGLPGWWLGGEDGRRLHPGITPTQWDLLLQETGFSGVDLVYNDLADNRKHCTSLLVSQAVDDRYLGLRDPLPAMVDMAQEAPLLVIGGKTLNVSKMSREIQKLVPASWRRQVQVITDLDILDIPSLLPGTDVICLQELDSALFSVAVNNCLLRVVQNLLLNAKNVIWAVANGKTGNPESNMFLGIARALQQELPHVNLQYVNLGSGQTPSGMARTVLEAFVRLKIASSQPSGVDNMVWTLEPEIVVDDCQILIPRVLPDRALNERYNACRRTLRRSVDSAGTVIQVVAGQNTLALAEPTSSKRDSDHVRVTAQYCLHIPSVNDKGIYICCGYLEGSRSPVLVASPTNQSILEVPGADVVPIEEQDCNPSTLQQVTADLFAQAISSLIVSSTGPMLVYDAEDVLATSIVTQCEQKCKTNGILFAASSPSIQSGWIYVHPQGSVRATQRRIPNNIAVFVDCSRDLGARHVIQSCLPKSCENYKLDAKLLLSVAQEGLAKSYSRASSNTNFFFRYPVMDVRDLPGLDVSVLNAPFITNWKTTAPLQLPIKQPSGYELFQPNKTYLMVGMAGGLGLSVCLWAIRQGARHVVITSRNPKMDEQCFQEARLAGADIRIIPMDVSSRSSVELVVCQVRETMPPIGGVCNAAMVLSDKLFIDMDAEILDTALKPKVDGTQHLHDVFADDHLDFFILFSSLGSIVGNPGQSNYHAANLFMTGLAAQRRDQGLTASVIHIGLVTDVGYVARQDRSVQDHLRGLLFRPLSETDIHHAFSEAVEAGKPDSKRSFEIIMGIEPLSKPLPSDRQPWWLSNNPQFAHFKPPVTFQQEQRATKSTSGSIKEGVEKSDSEDGAIALVQEAFSAKLESMMQLPAGSVQVQQSLLSLGIDSLVAVEIRTWFLKELGTDVPVLKILGGDTVAQICTAATRRLLANMLEKEQTMTPNPEDTADSTSSTGDSFIATPDSGDSSATSELGNSKHISSEDRGLDEVRPGKPRKERFDSASQSQEPTSIQEETMSDPQSRIWFISKHLNDPTTYNMTVTYEVQGHLSIPRLRHALRTMLQHHEGLRTRFYARPEDGHPMQGVLSTPVYLFKHVDNASDADVARERDYLKHRIWDLEQGRTLGTTVLSRNLESHAIILGYHHIIMDGMSLHLFWRDLHVIYQMQTPQHNTGTCIEYASQMLQVKQTQIMRSHMQYWKDEYASLPRVLPLLPMARARARPLMLTYETHHVYREIDHDQMAALKKTCQALRITPFHFHLSIIQVLVARYAGTQDICIGVADANRADERFANTIGFFLNLLPVRFQVLDGDNFSELAQAAARKVFAALANSSVPFDTILDQVNVPRSAAHTPLFQIAINYRMGAVWEVPLGDCRMTMSDVQDARNPYDLSFGIIDTSSGTSMVELAGQGSLYDADACQTILNTYMRLLRIFTNTPTLSVQDCQLNDPSDVSSALTLGRGPRVEFDWPQTLAGRMQMIYGAHGSNVAVKDRSQSLTYSQLAERVNSIAGRIREAQCRPGSRIAVLCEPSVDFIVSMLAILHIGAVYVPLDISLPLARHVSIIRSCQPSLLLYHAATEVLAEDLTGDAGYALLSARVDEMQAHRELIPCLAEPDCAAVLLFTSGSTGTPKGILLSQSNFVNHLALKTHALGLQQELVLQQSSMGFDMSLIQVFCALANGGTLVIAPVEARRDPVEITQIMLREQITLTIATPSEYLMWLQYGTGSLEKHSAWRHACMGGESVSDQLKGEFRRLELPSLTLTNCYGPTEITAAATFQRISLRSAEAVESPHAVGKALPNYSVYIVDHEGQPLPVGLQGEICIGGAGVSLGYLDLPDQTAQRFIRDIAATTGDRYQTMYRTGDRGRLLSDGTLIYLGRLDGDTQIKLHGVRIELGEIEAAILEVARNLLSHVVVTAREDVLVAHAIFAPGQTATDAELQHLLTRLHLPQYMCPARLVVLDDLPTNANGKVDRKALQELPLPEGEKSSPQEGKMTLREGELRILWEKVLPDLKNAQRLSPKSDFFLEGGNSLRLMKLQGAIKEAMEVSISTHKLYQACTLRQMAACIDNCRDAPAEEYVDWSQETAVPDTILAAARDRQKKWSQRIPRDRINVLVTGSTSFLGIGILKTLIDDETVRQIHCVAVLPDEEQKLPRSAKVVAYTGSLSSPTLGLGRADCEQLQSTVDVIVHAGSSGHCLNHYSSLRVPNVYSTQLLASFAVRWAVPLLYLSSNRVGLLCGDTAPLPVSMASFPPPTDGKEGFTASKWASECFLENLAACVPLPIQVHRPCVVVGTEAPNSDALNAILKYSTLMRAVPRFDRVEGYLDFQPVEDAAREIAEEVVAFAKHSPAAGPVRFRHHSGKVKVPVQEYRTYMEQTHGHAFEELAIKEWIAKALQAGIDPLITTYLEGIVERAELVSFPYLGETSV